MFLDRQNEFLICISTLDRRITQSESFRERGNNVNVAVIISTYLWRFLTNTYLYLLNKGKEENGIFMRQLQTNRFEECLYCTIRGRAAAEAVFTSKIEGS